MQALNDMQTVEPLGPNEFYVLDAPGINGMGADSLYRMEEHIAKGGELLHKAKFAEDGSIIFCNPEGMWPKQHVKYEKTAHE